MTTTSAPQPQDDGNEGKQSKARRKPPAEGVAHQEVPAPPDPTIKTTIELSYPAHERLHIHAFRLKKSHSKLVEELIETHLRRFTVQDRGGTAGEAA